MLIILLCGDLLRLLVKDLGIILSPVTLCPNRVTVTTFWLCSRSIFLSPNNSFETLQPTMSSAFSWIFFMPPSLWWPGHCSIWAWLTSFCAPQQRTDLPTPCRIAVTPVFFLSFCMFWHFYCLWKTFEDLCKCTVLCCAQVLKQQAMVLLLLFGTNVDEFQTLILLLTVEKCYIC